jgi:hypothetical protein
MPKPEKGITFLVLIALEIFLGLAFGRSESFGNAKVDRLAHEYVTDPTPQNKAALKAEWEAEYAWERGKNRIVLSLLAVNSCLIAVVGYKLIRPKSQTAPYFRT